MTFGDDLRSLRCQFAKEAASIAFVAGCALLLNSQQDRIGIAVDQDLLHDLYVAAFFTFVPETFATATVVDGPPTGNGEVCGRLPRSDTFQLPASSQSQLCRATRTLFDSISGITLHGTHTSATLHGRWPVPRREC